MSSAVPKPSPITPSYKAIGLKSQNPKEAERIAEEFDLSPIAAAVLAARGFKADRKLKHFLSPSLKEGLPDPKELLNLEAACELVLDVARRNMAIAVCCDFDVDGLSGGSQVHHFLVSLGIKYQVFVPDRFEDGYGLNERMIRQIAEAGFALLIAIDFGTTNLNELTLAKKLGLKTIVIDHHHVGGKKPPCDIFINPQQSGCGFADELLCASGLAWYFVLGLRGKLKGAFKEAGQIDAKLYLDLACLGTICDMVPLIGPNRVIAKRGLELLSATTRPGLLALKGVAGVKSDVSCYDISFGIGPRLNAAGRMVHGQQVVELLTTDDRSLADSLAQRLNRLNAERQETEAKVKELALEQLKETYSGGALPTGLVVWDERFHTGVVGLVAQRLVETFYRPSVVLGRDSPGIFKGSVRGVKNFNVVEALAACKENLIKYGGHEGAGGLSLDQGSLEKFRVAFIGECERRLEEQDRDPVSEADTEVELGEIGLELIKEFKSFAPFGMGNPNPQLLVRNLRVVDIRELKSAHLKATLSDGRRQIAGLLWRQTYHPALKKGGKVNAVFRPDINNFNGMTEIQAHLQAIEAA
ncbi:MAG: single-stranded-DNA-specific exonuclease RecJ [Proteobacteria bacterium]|nr:MAG: single-stranded-DNA-specific exonuclease RecJ [Pseudomonadota bacterium]